MANLSESFVESIAQTLNSAQVPCVLWGHCLLNLHGVPSIIDSIDYIVPDSLLSTAATALESAPRLSQCPDVDVCTASSAERMTPPPAFHMHVDASDVTVGLYQQSTTLWFLPPLDDTLLAPRPLHIPAHYVLASDRKTLPAWRPGRGSGVFKASQHPVLAPQAHVLLEAFLRLYARDIGTPVGGFGMAMICYMEQYVDSDMLLDTSQLPAPLGDFYRELKKGSKPVRQWTMELKEALGLPLIDLDKG